MVDFMYIGAPRAASTWLYKNLEQHPDVWVPPCKNILYFHPRFPIYRIKMLKNFGRKMFVHQDPAVRRWYRRFLLSPFVGTGWYRGLFPDDADLCVGEIAEAYCSLEERDVARIHALNPEMKIVFVMRNPYERALSHAKLGVLKRKGRKVQDVSDAALLRHIDHPSSEARSTYSRCLDLWGQYFPQEQFFVRFYEDIQAKHLLFLNDLCSFLNVNYQEQFFEQTVDQSVNLSGSDDGDLSLAVRQYTARKYYEETVVLAERFGGVAEDWLTGVRALLAES